MKAKGRISVALMLAIAGALLLVASAVSALFDRISKRLDASPQRLVYHTDHTAVLLACQQVLAEPQAAGFPKAKNGYSTVNGSQGGATPPAALPAVLRDLDFEFMTVDGDRATIYFGSGFGHWGYSTAAARGGSQLELIPGLWFWSEGTLPRDLSKFPYYRTSQRMLLGGLLTLGAAIVLMKYTRRSAMALNT